MTTSTSIGTKVGVKVEELKVGARVRCISTGLFYKLTGTVSEVQKMNGCILYRVVDEYGHSIGTSEASFWTSLSSWELVEGPEEEEGVIIGVPDPIVVPSKPCPLMYYGIDSCTCGKCTPKGKVRVR